MGFQKVSNPPEYYIEDRERGAIFKRKLGGQDFGVYELSLGGEIFIINVREEVKSNGTYWDIHKIDYPKDFDVERKSDVVLLVEEAIEATLDTFWKQTKNTKFNIFHR
jgi:hypothetical protein